MAISKIILNGVTQMDLTQDTTDASKTLATYTGHGADGEAFTGTYVPTTPTGNINITQAGVTDVTNYATATVPTATFWVGNTGEFYSDGGVLKFRVRGDVELSTSLGDTEGWIGDGNYYGDYTNYNAVPSNTHITPSSSTQTVGGSNYVMQGAVTIDAMPTGTAGTPTATKGAVSNHSVSVTPSVTNTTGYITGSTKTGTAVTVSASELVSGSETKTANGTYDVTNLASLVVNVSGGGSSKNAQVVQQNNTRITSTTYSKACGDITVSKTGTYDVYWTAYRTSTSGTWGTQLYIGSTAYGTAQATFSSYYQTVHLTNVSLTANQKVSVYGRSRGSNYYLYVGQLTIIES